jgi:hypothetical protein
MYLGFLVGPAVVGGVAAATTLRTSLTGVAALGLLVAALAAIIRLPRRETPETTSRKTAQSSG